VNCCRCCGPTGSAGGPPASGATTLIGAPPVVDSIRALGRTPHGAGGPPALPVGCVQFMDPGEGSFEVGMDDKKV